MGGVGSNVTLCLICPFLSSFVFLHIFGSLSIARPAVTGGRGGGGTGVGDERDFPPLPPSMF